MLEDSCSVLHLDDVEDDELAKGGEEVASLVEDLNLM